MKIFLTIICFFASLNIASAKSTFLHLAEINKCWLQQTDVDNRNLPLYKEQSDRKWIKIHLRLVEKIQRQRSTASLTSTQKINRLQALDRLHEYWLAERFPINEHYNFRTPIFIDKQDNFCAVGYLIKATGYESISRMIAAKANLAYVEEMNFPELMTWATNFGFTKDELAWIQPTYGPQLYTAPIGNGVIGQVNELFVADDTMYVGGAFSKIDSTIPALNIAYVTEIGGNYTWHKMDSGVNGPVHAITRFGNRIFIAGSFSMSGDSSVNNVAYWEGGKWRKAGCISGVINDLVVYNNELYAGGSFDFCAGLSDINLAKWNGTNWQSVYGLSGMINTMEVFDSTLYIGGVFKHNNDTVNAIKYRNSTFTRFTNGTRNQINDFAAFNDTLYMVGQYMPGGDSNYLFSRIVSNAIDTLYYFNYTPSMAPGSQYWSLKPILKTIEPTIGLHIGGRFYRSAAPISVVNSVVLTPLYQGPVRTFGGMTFFVDSTINKMIYFKGQLISGGAFRWGYRFSGGLHILNGMCRRFIPTVQVPQLTNYTFKVFPNPTNNRTIFIENDFSAESYRLFDMSGAIFEKGILDGSNKQRIYLPHKITTGNYILEIKNANNAIATQKIMVE